jgi:uncharacterized 2Fe-2S/4Fe-4S cluster protein (DUF4445 family)
MTTSQRTQVEGLEVATPAEPAVRAYRIELAAPTLSDFRADADRLLIALNEQHGVQCQTVDVDVLRELSPQMRSWEWEAQASVRNDEVIALGPWPGAQLGLAVDLGTTKIAEYLVDLTDGRTVAARGVMNPQISYGEDVIARIDAAAKSLSGGMRMRKLAVDALNRLAADLCAEAGVETGCIVDVAIVGNTAMHHLLLGLPVGQLARSPFVPAISMAMDVSARDLGLQTAPGSCAHLLPNIAGFVGSDHVAMLLATEVSQAEEPVIALDIGTNTEVSLVNKGKITTVSCASGPAFEGYHIKHGMRAAGGAIERVRMTRDGIQYQTVDSAAPSGICGSGIVDAVARLYQEGVLEESGRMAGNHGRLRTRRKQREFVLVSSEERDGRPAIVVSQSDVREIQLAKAAIRTGIQALLETGGCAEEELSRIVIAGAFGTYIDVSSAMVIGMLPSIPEHRVHQVGNAAGSGARMALVSVRERARAQALASQVEYIELASAPGFSQTFVQAGYLGRYRLENGHREALA